MNNLFRVDENRIEQCFAAHIVHSCQQYSSALLHLIQAQQHCSILATVQNNVGSKTLFNPVLINAPQVVQFLLCRGIGCTAEWHFSGYFFYSVLILQWLASQTYPNPPTSCSQRFSRISSHFNFLLFQTF